MGTCKALIKLNGTTMLQRTLEQLSDFEEILLSTNDPALGQELPVRAVPDLQKHCGPLGGLHAALMSAESESLFCVPCDLPDFSAAMPRVLLESLTPEADAIICRDSTGRIHPLCGIYRKRVLPTLEEQLTRKEYRVMAFADRLNCQILDTGGILPDRCFWNMNTPESCRLWQETQ